MNILELLAITIDILLGIALLIMFKEAIKSFREQRSFHKALLKEIRNNRKNRSYVSNEK